MGRTPEELREGVVIKVTQAERPRITPDDLLRDGRSEEARRFAETWKKFHGAKKLTAVVSCSDARVFYDPHAEEDGDDNNDGGVFVYKAIAAAVSDQLIGPAGILNPNFGTRRVVVMGHHAGSSVRPGKRPEECGGLHEKAKMKLMRNKNQVGRGEGAAAFVDQRIVHEDPIITAWFNAYKIAEGAGIPALGVTEDHETGDLSVLIAAVPTNRGIEIISDISLSKVLQDQYKVAELYANGIPALADDRIPDEFKLFLSNHRKYAAAMRHGHRNFAETQRVQDPDTLLFTSVIRPTRGRLPEIAGPITNRMFTITVPRDVSVSLTDVSFEGLQDASDELEYPLAKAEESQGQPGMPFSSLYNGGTVIFETKHMDHSRRLAEDLLREKPWLREWEDREGNRIIAVETTKGLVQKAEYLESERYQARGIE